MRMRGINKNDIIIFIMFILTWLTFFIIIYNSSSIDTFWTDIEEVKTDISNIKTDISDIKVDIDIIKEKLEPSEICECKE